MARRSPATAGRSSGGADTDYADVPAEFIDRLRVACAHLPEIIEEKAWTGRRWRVRNRPFAHVLTIENENGLSTIVTFRAAGEELDALLACGHPFFSAGWGTNVVGMVLDGDTDWDEVSELLTESYCVLAPKKLIKLVDRPEVPE